MMQRVGSVKGCTRRFMYYTPWSSTVASPVISLSHCDLLPSNSPGTISTKYSTIASGPLSTCSPCGIACVLIPGLSFCAMLLIVSASSCVHMDAEKSTLGWCCRTVGATSSIAGEKVREGSIGVKEMARTSTVCDIFYVVTILKRFDHAANEAFCAIGCGVDSDEAEGALAWLRHFCHNLETGYSEIVSVVLLMSCRLVCGIFSRGSVLPSSVFKNQFGCVQIG
jgi:hypothetical protein